MLQMMERVKEKSLNALTAVNKKFSRISSDAIRDGAYNCMQQGKTTVKNWMNSIKTKASGMPAAGKQELLAE